MAVRLGTNQWGREKLYYTDLNDTFNVVANEIIDMKEKGNVIQQIYTDAVYNIKYLSQLIYIRVNGTTIERTTDGGQNWTTVKTGITTGGYINVNANNPNYIVYFVSAYNGTAIYSIDAGVTWNTITRPTDSDEYYVAYSITDSHRIYAIYSDTGNTEVAYTDNYGTNWTVVTDPGTVPEMNPSDLIEINSPKNECIAVTFFDASNSYCYSCYSLNSGSTWTSSSMTGGNSAYCHIMNCQYLSSTHYQIDLQLKVAYGEQGQTVTRWNNTLILPPVYSNSLFALELLGSSNYGTVRCLLEFSTNRIKFGEYVMYNNPLGLLYYPQYSPAIVNYNYGSS